MTPFPSLQLVLLINNAQAHNKAKLKELYSSHDIKILFLLPYSLDLNLIKLLFNKLKL